MSVSLQGCQGPQVAVATQGQLLKVVGSEVTPGRLSGHILGASQKHTPRGLSQRAQWLSSAVTRGQTLHTPTWDAAVSGDRGPSSGELE